MASPSNPPAHLGLSASQARERLERDGPNELPAAPARGFAAIAWEVVQEPMLAMLLAAGGIYLLLGDTTEAVILTVFAGLSIAITIIQEARTEKVLLALRDLSAPRALVIRDGETVRVPGREVVEGDILVLEQGDRIAADATLLEAVEFEADESLLTGESVPVRKRAARAGEPPEAEPGGDDLPQVFSGSMVTRGRGIACTMATGPRSRIGRIGTTLATLEPEVPRLQREAGRIVRICAASGVALALLVVLLYGLRRGDWLDALLAGVATAMSLMPEEFPVVLTIFLAMGAWRIAQGGVLTRRAAAIETLGAATVLCTDKTGTLTQNRMTVVELWLPSGERAELRGDAVEPDFRNLLEASALASAPVPVDPMEVAFHAAAREAGVVPREDWELVHSYGLTPDLLAMSNIWRSEEQAPHLVAAKGAPEAIARLCRLDGMARQELEEAARAMAGRGMRVLGIASAPATEGARDKAHEEHEFRLLGLAGLADPLRSGVGDAVAQCRSAGVRVVMITGDYAATAAAIAAEAGIEAVEVMTGTEVAALSDAELAGRVGTVSIFARTMPEQKLRIVEALKAAGEVVAMTGDGVNDAPALKAAHIGIAMGRRGTDVAREAAAIVLVDDDFGAIVGAVRQGRRIYDNIRKALAFIFAVHVPIGGLAVLPLVAGLPIILGPLQIALLELVIDPVCALVFEAEREEARIMRRPPRDPRERLFSGELIRRGLVQGGLAMIVVAGLCLGAGSHGMPENELRAFSFFALLAAIIALILTNRSFGSAIAVPSRTGNSAFRYVLALVAAGVALILAVPEIQRILKFAPLEPWQLLLAASSGIALVLVFEVTKRATAMGQR